MMNLILFLKLCVKINFRSKYVEKKVKVLEKY